MADPQNRFEDRNQRVALRIPVELGQGGFEDPFEASSVNLSKGGLSMRSACLPDPGTRLACRFRALPSGTLLTAQGEVVWAHLDGAESGEFGLSFVDLDPKTEWLIEEMLAEQARLDGPRADGEVTAAVAQLELEGSGGAITARVAKKDGQTVVFEQPLDVLSVGRGVHAHAAGVTGKQGSITGVELRMVGSVPMLAVTVAFDERGSSVGFVPAETAAEAGPEHDTAPDLTAPEARSDVDPRMTLLEFEARGGLLEAETHASAHADPDADPEFHALAEQDVADDDARAGHMASVESMAAGLVHELPTANPALDAPDASLFASPLTVSEPPPPVTPIAREPRIVREPLAQPMRDPLASPARESAAPATRELLATQAREPSVSFRVSRRTEADDEAALAAMFEPEASSLQRVATRVLLALRVHGGALLRALGPLGERAWHAAGPVVRTLWLRVSALSRTLIVQRVAPQLGALKRVLVGAFSQRRRRKTTAPAAMMASEERSGLWKTVLMSVMGAAAVAMAVYAFAPVASDDELATDKPVKRMRKADGAPPDAVATPPAAEPLTAPDPQLVPSASNVPASSPFAVDVRGARPSAKSAGTSNTTPVATPPPGKGKALRFGAAQVSNAKRFTLRMSAKITALEGAADAGGFTVVATGGLALDRAGPISSALPSVARSMIINRGDRAELTIRFAEGKKPAYQVTAEGGTLTVVIQDL
jgi:hypothetical protein